MDRTAIDATAVGEMGIAIDATAVGEMGIAIDATAVGEMGIAIDATAVGEMDDRIETRFARPFAVYAAAIAADRYSEGESRRQSHLVLCTSSPPPASCQHSAAGHPSMLTLRAAGADKPMPVTVPMPYSARTSRVATSS